ncbi:M17 family peptidase N-terminal domain-containing protein [Polaromonas jejuensis]|uniref:M17 family peptidase N-terminal domain-containing protein n=1 Tax=Polaromonas jejuensis TaxID=457502 RepID=A0ABW0Q876_9BURK|nr:M17 family peptidase N-terminal domain-containing protein [Polaromonas jejuensis]
MTSTHLDPDSPEGFSHGKVTFKAVVMSPSATDTALQVVCFPDQTLNQTYGGGTELVDAGFKGAIRDLRREDIFRGERLETLLLQPARQQIPARNLLLIGLGDPTMLTLDTLTAVGRVAAREAIKLNVWSFCFAPSLKDAGLSLFDASEVSVALARGMTQAISRAQTLHARGLQQDFLLEEVIFLAGTQHFESSLKGLRTAFGK